MCLSTGTPKWKINYFRCPKTLAYYSLIIMCLNIGSPNIHHFPFGTNGIVVVLGVPILKDCHPYLFCGFRNRSFTKFR